MGRMLLTHLASTYRFCVHYVRKNFFEAHLMLTSIDFKGFKMLSIWGFSLIRRQNGDFNVRCFFFRCDSFNICKFEIANITSRHCNSNFALSNRQILVCRLAILTTYCKKQYACLLDTVTSWNTQL